LPYKIKIMAKIIGMAMAIFSGLMLLGQLFLYQNTSAHLPYNPADKAMSLSTTGLLSPIVMTGLFFIIGVVLYKFSTEPENY